MKQKKQILWLIGLLAALALVWYFNQSKPRTSAGTVAFSENYTPMGIPDPAPHIPDMEETRKTEYTKTVRNIFTIFVPPPPAPVAGKGSTFVKVGPEPLPPPPPLTLPPNMKYFGYGTVPADGARLAFLTNGDDVFIVGEGETLLGRYRILKVGNDNLEFEEISSGRHGTTILEEQAPSA